MPILKYCYHATAAFVLNIRASYWSKQIKKGNPGGANLKQAGKQSNIHEKARDNAAKEIKAWFKWH